MDTGDYRPVRPSPLATFQELCAFIARGWHPAWSPPAFQADKATGAVLVIPPLLNDDRSTAELRAALNRAGYAAFGWNLGIDLGPTPKLLEGIQARLLAIAAEHGPISLVGLSMGGLFCRWLAHRHPDKVRQVVTICSPFRQPLDSFFLPLRPAMKVWQVPDLATMAEEVAKPLPVPVATLYSRRDGIVAWESCHDPQRPQESVAIDSPHLTICTDPTVHAVVLERLAA